MPNLFIADDTETIYWCHQLKSGDIGAQISQLILIRIIII